MAYSSYLDYIKYESSLSESERKTHFREDYKPNEQLWPEYLDYLDEWEFLYSERLTSTLQDFVWHYLIQPRQKIKCGDHYHVFSTIPLEYNNASTHNEVYTSIENCTDVHACWYKTLLHSNSLLRDIDSRADSARLSVPESEIIKRSTQLNLMLKDHITHDKLDFRQFSTQWWSQESVANAIKIFRQSTTPLITINVPDTIPTTDTTQTTTSRRNSWFWPVQQEENIFSGKEVANDHGLHMLMKSSEQPKILFSMINEIRRQAPIHTLIDEEDLLQSISNCSKCYEGIPSYPSPLGVYYAPPGNGKTTTLEYGLFIGIDTDWLNRGGTFDNIIRPFLNHAIPVFTNQYDIVPQSGYKLFGIFSNNLLKNNPSTHTPYTTIQEISAAKISYGDDLCIFNTTEYTANLMVLLYRSISIYDMAKQMLNNHSSPTLSITRSWQPLSYNQLLSMISKWVDYTPKAKRAKRSKFKKKHRR